MIPHECSPGLPTDAFWASLPHILLDGPFTHANIQFEKFATDTLCSAESVVGCHLLNQGNRLGRKLWLSHTRLRFAFPEETKKLPMPAQERLWLDEEEGLFPSSDHPCQEHQQKPVCPLNCRRKMMSCCRNSAFSASSSALPPVKSANVPSTREAVSGLIQRETHSWSACRRKQTRC
jgi:hypothetical protein